MSAKRTILSPFTKEYRVLVTYSGIRLFLEGGFLWISLKIQATTFMHSTGMNYLIPNSQCFNKLVHQLCIYLFQFIRDAYCKVVSFGQI